MKKKKSIDYKLSYESDGKMGSNFEDNNVRKQTRKTKKEMFFNTDQNSE
ncbi:hypothetical protein LCL95_04855 [Bacillus timonensis]|nr:hypothetical protein [Bacillus timonensis]